MKRKYRRLYSNEARKKPGRKPPSQALIDLVLEMKRRNPNYGFRRIAMQIFQSFGIDESVALRSAVFSESIISLIRAEADHRGQRSLIT